MLRSIAIVVGFTVTCAASAADVKPLIQRLKSVGPEGAGSGDAKAAWAELARQDNSAILPIMVALDDASPQAANWLRSALDAIIERERTAKRPLPVAELKQFLADSSHHGRARRLAFELVTHGDPAVAKAMLQTFLNDPSLELRFEAVADGFATAKSQPKVSADAKSTMRKLIQASRDADQVEEIAKELDNRGDPVDFIKLYGFITQWYLCGTYDNTAGKGFAVKYPPESKVDLKATTPGKDGKEVKWEGHATPDKMAVVDLNKVLGKQKNAVAYAYTEIDSPEDRPVELRAASAAAVKIYLNGQEIVNREVYHQGLTVDSHIGAGRLKKGKNAILIKLCQNNQKEPWAQDWKFQLRVSDSLGTPVPVHVEPVTVKQEGTGS